MNKELLSNKCNAFLDETMNLNDLPGLAIGVSIGGTEAMAEPIGDAEAMAEPAGGADAKATNPVEFVGVRGYNDYFTCVPMKEDDIFHCASVSKLFTSSAIMKLVEAGVLDLEDRLCDLLPDLRIADERFKEIRLWNMLTHTSGLGDVSDYHWYAFETDEDSLRRYVYESDEVLQQPMLWEPRECRFRYSNIAYEILGQIVAEYSGRMPDAKSRQLGAKSRQPGAKSSLSYEDFIACYLLEPAGMTDSTMKTYERDINHIAQPHEKKSDRSIGPVEYYPYTRQHAPSSTLTSNVRDLLRWGRAHLASSRGLSAWSCCGTSGSCSDSSDSCSGLLLRPETYRTIWRAYATVPNNGEKMGLGWFMREQTVTAVIADSQDTDGKQQSTKGSIHTYKLCGHEGTDDGFRASFWICPELDMVTVVLSNLSGAPVKKINKKLFNVIAADIPSGERSSK